MSKISTNGLSSLAQRIKSGSCVLFIGPHLDRVTSDNKTEPILSQLATKLFGEGHQFDYSKDPENAFRMATHFFENAQRIHGEAKARDILIDTISNFYSEIEPDDFLKELAGLNFKVVININTNDLFEKAVRSIGKRPHVHYFNYGNPLHNNQLNLNLETITARTPLIYNLFGSLENRRSLVITETDKLLFAEELLQKESKASISNDILELIHPETSTYLFAGFDFNDWQLRLLFQKLGVNYDSKTVALYKPDRIQPLSNYLFENHFFVDFSTESPLEFINELKNTSAKKEEGDKENAKNVMVLYHEDDSDVWDEIGQQLKVLEQNDLINEVWHNEKIIAGQSISDETLHHLNEADVILFLASASFNSSDKLYLDNLNKALVRHEEREACVIPIHISAMNLDLTSYGDLATLTPANGPLGNNTEDRAQKIREIVSDIKDIITHWQWKS